MKKPTNVLMNYIHCLLITPTCFGRLLRPSSWCTVLQSTIKCCVWQICQRFYKFRSRSYLTHKVLLYSLIMYTVTMLAVGDRNMQEWSINKCNCWFLHKACLNARYGTHKIVRVLFPSTLQAVSRPLTLKKNITDSTALRTSSCRRLVGRPSIGLSISEYWLRDIPTPPPPI
jgi:hypothetical protein